MKAQKSRNRASIQLLGHHPQASAREPGQGSGAAVKKEKVVSLWDIDHGPAEIRSSRLGGWQHDHRMIRGLSVAI